MFVRHWILTFSLACAAVAQEEPPADGSAAAVETRAGQIELQRQEKAQTLEPEEEEKGEEVFDRVQHSQIFERLTGEIEGWRIMMGGMIPYSGFSLGPEYYRHLLHQQAIFQTTAVGSYKKFYKVDSSFRMPSLVNDHAFFSLNAMTFNYPRVDYYGQGPNSSKRGRTDYSLEESGFSGSAGVKPFRYLSIGATGSYLFTYVGPGHDDSLASSTDVFNNQTAPGLESPSNFAQGGGFVAFDWRDNPGDATHGGLYSVHYTDFDDVRRSHYSFQRLDLEADQYFGFLNDQHVIALRGKVEATEAGSDQQIPFYLEPTLGGPDDLRGYRAFRFYDHDAAVFTGEYRWNVLGSLAMAIFYDAGQVFDKWQQIGLHNLHTDYGFGFRVKTSKGVFMRVDTGFSHEGVAVWARFNNIY
jgi:outer membrane protein assembly factor BamA